MTGAEHYREAERILEHAEEWAHANSTEWYENAVAAGQVHATLALAAAAAYPAVRDWIGDEATDGRDWSAVTS